MRTLSCAIVALGCAALLAGCARDRQQYASSDTSEFVTVEPTDVSATKITRYADEDRDGQVTRKEAKADKALAAAFDRYDLDDNDKLDRGEFARLESARRERTLASQQEQASHQAAQHSDRWLVEKPDGYFGPERRRHQTLNRTGAGQGRLDDSELR